MPQRKRPLNEKYKLVAQNLILKNMSVVGACKEADLSTKSWYTRYQDDDIKTYMAELETVKLKRKPEDESIAKSVKDKALKLIIDEIDKGNIKAAEVVIRCWDRFENLGGQELDLGALIERMSEAGISLDQIKIPDEPEI